MTHYCRFVCLEDTFSLQDCQCFYFQYYFGRNFVYKYATTCFYKFVFTFLRNWFSKKFVEEIDFFLLIQFLFLYIHFIHSF